MKTVTKKLSELRHPEKNVRMHTDRQLAEFRRSVEMFGQIRPIVVDENNVILAGNGLFETLLSMGRSEADCYVVRGLTENEKKKLMLADNRIFDLGVDDMRVFDEIIAELGGDLDVPGFDDELLRSLVADAAEIDSMMSSYGLITEEKKTEMADAANAYRQAEEARAAQTAENGDPDDAQAGGGPPTPSFVICTQCGKKIWL